MTCMGGNKMNDTEKAVGTFGNVNENDEYICF